MESPGVLRGWTLRAALGSVGSAVPCGGTQHSWKANKHCYRYCDSRPGVTPGEGTAHTSGDPKGHRHSRATPSPAGLPRRCSATRLVQDSYLLNEIWLIKGRPDLVLQVKPPATEPPARAALTPNVGTRPNHTLVGRRLRGGPPRGKEGTQRGEADLERDAHKSRYPHHWGGFPGHAARSARPVLRHFPAPRR